MTWMME
jgi:hypothetical protein